MLHWWYRNCHCIDYCCVYSGFRIVGICERNSDKGILCRKFDFNIQKTQERN